MPHICASALLSSHKKPTNAPVEHVSASAERIRKILSFLRRVGSFFDLINFTKRTTNQINETIGSANKRKIKIEKESISHLQNLIRKAIFLSNASAKF